MLQPFPAYFLLLHSFCLNVLLLRVSYHTICFAPTFPAQVEASRRQGVDLCGHSVDTVPLTQ